MKIRQLKLERMAAGVSQTELGKEFGMRQRDMASVESLADLDFGLDKASSQFWMDAIQSIVDRRKSNRRQLIEERKEVHA